MQDDIEEQRDRTPSDIDDKRKLNTEAGVPNSAASGYRSYPTIKHCDSQTITLRSSFLTDSFERELGRPPMVWKH